MADFLSRLLDRSFDRTPVLTPRRASLFEVTSPSLATEDMPGQIANTPSVEPVRPPAIERQSGPLQPSGPPTTERITERTQFLDRPAHSKVEETNPTPERVLREVNEIRTVERIEPVPIAPHPVPTSVLR